MTDRPRCVGVDGCRGGWFAIALSDDDGWAMALLKDADALGVWVDGAQLTLVDIPIGLLDAGPEERLCDRAARRRLGRPRSSSVFRAPARPALQGGDYPSANALNRRATGVGLSRQGFGITAKIAAMDALLRQNPRCAAPLRESHPEVCFQALNGGQAMSHNKKTAPGRAERGRVLSAQLASADEIIAAALATYRRADVAHDDILDALILAVTAQLGSGSPNCLRCLPADPPCDAYGLPMEIVYTCPPRPPPQPA